MSNDISIRIKEAIEKSGLTLLALEKKTKIPKSAIQRYASGNTEKLPIDRVKKIAEATGVSPAYLMGWDLFNTTDETKENIRKASHLLHKDYDEMLSLFCTNRVRAGDTYNASLNDLLEAFKDYYSKKEEKTFSDFTTVEEAMQFIIQSPVVSAYGGYDLDKMPDDEIIQFANELTEMFKLIANGHKNK